MRVDARLRKPLVDDEAATIAIKRHHLSIGDLSSTEHFEKERRVNEDRVAQNHPRKRLHLLALMQNKCKRTGCRFLSCRLGIVVEVRHLPNDHRENFVLRLAAVTGLLIGTIAATAGAAEAGCSLNSKHFSTLRMGMSLSAVKENVLFFCKGEQTDVTRIGSKTYETWVWDGRQDGSGIVLVFENKRLFKKSQSRLDETSSIDASETAVR